MGKKKSNGSRSAAGNVPAVANARPQRSRIAKLSVPKLHGALLRDRLFAKLDECASRPLIWVAGPPGAGKTTLVASYLDQTSREVLWYRADGGDSDLSSFFYHLREAALALDEKRAARLPLLTPEYLLDTTTFARNFFRSLFAILKCPAAFVIDNFQDADEGVLEVIIPLAIRELPNNVNLYSLSRGAPPASLLTLEVQGKSANVDWNDLRLTTNEAQSIAHNAGVDDDRLVSSLHAECDGWTAGFVLLLQFSKQAKDSTSHRSIRAREAMFQYFSSELFAIAPHDTQQLTMCTALLPSFTLKQAGAFATVEQARSVIDWLLKHNFFIDAVEGTEQTFRYHALFKDFLLQRGKQLFAADERLGLIRQSMGLLEAAGELEAALALGIEVEAWDDCVRYLTTLAPGLMQQGRVAILERLIQSLPEHVLTASPWLQYWLGAAMLTFKPRMGREQLTVAYESLRLAGDPIGQILACSGIIQSFWFEWGDQHGLDRWFEALRELPTHIDIRLPTEVEAACVSCVLIGGWSRHLSHPVSLRLIERACELFRQIDNMDQRILIGSTAVYYFGMAGPVIRGRQLIDEINATVDMEALSPMPLLQWLMIETFYSIVSFRIDRYADMIATFEKAREIARQNGIQVMDAQITNLSTYCSLKAQDLARVEVNLERISAMLNLGPRPLDRAQHDWFRAALAISRGQMTQAHEFASETLRVSEELGCTFASAQGLIPFIDTLTWMNKHDRAQEKAVEFVTKARALKSQVLEYVALLLTSHVAFEAGDERAGIESLREALAFGSRTAQFSPSPWINPRILQRLCEIALQHGIESTHVRETIECMALRPTGLGVELWPGRIRLYTLGQFEIVKDDKPLRFEGKVQRRPMELLKAIVAFGGRGVAQDQLATALWPDAEGDAAHTAFGVALHRLRKLLDADDVIRVENHEVSLDPQFVWVDAWAFEESVNSLRNHPAVDQRGRVGSKDRILHLYRGGFLRGESAAWVVSPRERMRSKFLESVAVIGEEHERDQAWVDAVRWYERGIEVDPVSEDLYFHVMECYRNLSRHTDALGAYRRCKAALFSAFEINPGRRLESLFEEIRRSV